MNSEELTQLIASEIYNLLVAHTDLPESERKQVSKEYATDIASKINKTRADKMFKTASLTSEVRFEE